MKKKTPGFVGLGLVVGLLLASVALADVPVPNVPAGHPRVYLDPNDVNDIKAKILLPEFKDEWDDISSYIADRTPVASALVYLIDGTVQRGEDAIDDTLTALQASSDVRIFESEMHKAACVYDWCYDLLSTSEKNAFITEFARLATNTIGYPADIDTGAVSTGSTEGYLLTGQLPAGVAIYDENSVMYDGAAQLFFQKFVPVRDLYYPSHAHHQGDSYIYRFVHDIAATWLFRRMDAGNVFTGEQQYVPYTIIYNTRPDGEQIRRGDTYDESGNYGSKMIINVLTGSYYQDPYLMTMADNAVDFPSDFERVLEMIFREPNLPKSPISQLPQTKYFADPMGEMVARTGWDMGVDSNDAVVFMRIGGIFFHGHQHRDMGVFQIYYKGPLAICSGIYQSDDPCYPTEPGSEHYKNYYHQTLAQNGLLIFDPCEVPVNPSHRSVNDGGQRMPNNGWYPKPENLQTHYQLGEVTGWQFGPNTVTPEYSYISGDITNAYTDKVSEVTRSMVTLNLQDSNYPCSLITFDRITSTDPNFKKTWLIHSIQEPNVDANTITIVRNEGSYGGKLVTESLLPVSATITKIGGPGYQFWVEDSNTNYMVIPDDPCAEPGAWRVEVSPDTNQTEDVFLHVMTVMDDTEPNGPNVLTVVDNNDAVVGVRLLDRVVVFGKESSLLEEASFSVPGSGTAKILVCDLQPGLWSVSRADQNVATGLEATNQGKCIYFEGPTGLDGEYFLTVTDPNYESDFDGDSDVDFNDLAFIAGQWLSDNPQGHSKTGKSPDLKSDGIVNFGDLAIFNKDWLKGAKLPAPRALYEFEGNYNNSMGGPAGTPEGDATIVYDADRGSYVLSLDGAGDYVDCGSDSVPGIDTAITVAAWIKTSDQWFRYITSDGYDWALYSGQGGGGYLAFKCGGTTPGYIAGNSINDDKWHHVAGTYDETEYKLYIDGALKNTVAATGAIGDTTSYQFAIGAFYRVNPEEVKFEFDGRIDDVCVYDSVLSVSQIQRLLRQ